MGDTARLTFTFLDESGLPADPDSFDIRVLPPNDERVIIAWPDPSIVRQSVGGYTHDLDLELPGTWLYGTRATGAGKTAGENQLFVRSSALLT